MIFCLRVGFKNVKRFHNQAVGFIFIEVRREGGKAETPDGEERTRSSVDDDASVPKRADFLWVLVEMG
jgi:hypothetical protein